MMKKNHLIVAALLVLLVSPAGDILFAREKNDSRFDLELELGPVWQSRNDVQIPNSTDGTRFSLVDLVGEGPYPAGRLYFSWNINRRHGLRLLLAPLMYTEQGEFPGQVKFAGETFAPSVTTDATYKFNSWRLSYRYLLFDRSRWRGWIGFTAKIRDAKIELAQKGKSAKETDIGFVPLLHLSFDYGLTSRWFFAFDLDALAGGPGRAEDLSLKLRYELSEKLSLSAGYRTIEGGADVDRVYNFAWIHFATASIRYQF
ncbi:MAG: hypothetical protein JXB45_06970 [Candidatus Krumholzibacteriota bacterium]|nr:hypothetical protein [Candidatus Krumholzibacteriota bacterium]